MKELLEYLPRLRGKKIGVFGDLIADEYLFGTIHRFSREAPVFIVHYEEAQIRPGGAANAANNIHELGGISYPIGLLGNDQQGRALFAALKERNIATDGIVWDESHPTFVKQRVVAGSPHSVKQQILRIDRCLAVPENSSCHEKLEERFTSILPELDACIISDYGLGVVRAARSKWLVSEIRKRQIPVFVDSRYNLGSFHGITVATPNEPEVETLLGINLDSVADLQEAGKSLLNRLDAQCIVITRGKNGMAVFTRDNDPAYIPIFGSLDIVDVTGAGDTVTSMLALAGAAGASYFDAARLANCAAGIAVMKRGAATVSSEELAEAIRVASMNL